MLCSRCSELVAPVIAIDIDGTIGDYHTHFMNFAIDWLGFDRNKGRIAVYHGDLPYWEWFCKTFNTDSSTFRQIKTAYRAGGMKRTMPVVNGAPYFVNRLAGAEVWFTTTRPYLKFDGIDADTREWLLRNGIRLSHLLYDEDKYGVLATKVDPSRVVMVLDDEVEQVNRAADVFGSDVAYLMVTLNNAQAQRRPGTPWVSDLGVAGDIALKRIQKWA